MDVSSVSDSQFWLVVAGFMIAFILAFGIGANDVANSFGTSVGSKVLTLKQACILATIFEILGSILIGAKVSGTIRKGILDPIVFKGSELELMLGYVSALSGCCIWMIIATILNLPVSGTHSIVGATIGMAIVSRGFNVIKWYEVLRIVASWFVSPILSGVVSMLMFMLIRKFILRAKNPLDSGLKFLPAIYTITIFINIAGILESSPPLLGFDRIPWWGKLIMSVGISGLVYLSVWLMVCPFMKKKIEKNIANFNANQIFEAEEEEKINYYNSEDLKHTIATQVDYVELIVSRHPGNQENRGYQANTGRKVPQTNGKKPLTELPKEHVIKEDILGEKEDICFEGLNSKRNSPKRSYTLQSSSNSNLSKRNRIRLDSAPSSSVYKDQVGAEYTGGVNMALGGYLHSTIHSPTARAKSHNQKFQNSNLYRQYSASAAFTNNQIASNGAPIWNKLFSDSKENGMALQNDCTVMVPLNEDFENEKKKWQVGRFTSVPAWIDNSAPSEKDKINDELIELDAIVEEDISEILKKKNKIYVDDTFAHSDPPEAKELFSFLQILTAIFGSFAHGGNDVSNAIGPLIGLYLIYQEGQVAEKASTPEWILFYGGVGISFGLWILGRRVIKTIGEDLTKITPSSGFVIELASAITVLGASLFKIPVSTTHCKVGSVVFTGRVRSKESVDWSLFRNIIIAWIVTVPVAGSLAAAVQVMLKLAYGINLNFSE